MQHCERKMAPKCRRPWERVRVTVDLTGQVSKTDTSLGNDTNVNNIVARFARTGVLPTTNAVPQYADVTGLQVDLTEALERGKKARSELERLHGERIARDQEEATQAAIKAARDAERLAEYDRAAGLTS